MLQNFSDYIIFVDESGVPNLGNIDPTFPVFSLVFICVLKDEYIQSIVPKIQHLKMKYTGHDQLILHERDIRRQSKQFSFLQTSKELKLQFMNDLNLLVEESEFTAISSVVFKDKLVKTYAKPYDPYEIAMFLCMERTLDFLISKDQKGKDVHVIFESRGKAEDRNLDLEFQRIANNNGSWGYKAKDFKTLNWHSVFSNKTSNSSGLQLADLLARPIAKNRMNPDQENRAYDIIKPKLSKWVIFP